MSIREHPGRIGDSLPNLLPARKQFYHPELDLLRFVAFLLVFFHHLLPKQLSPGPHSAWAYDTFLTFLFSAGNGLNLFFLLSSYLITELLLREREATGSIHIKAFYVRRVLRIWPLYFAFLAFGYLLGHVNAGLYISPAFVLHYLFLFGNLAFYHNTTMNPIGPLWSISVEEQFYLCWPFLARKVGRQGLLIFSLLLFPLSILSSIWLTYHAAEPGLAIWTHSFTEFECFGAGALLAIALHHKAWRIGAFTRIALVFGCIAAWAVSDGVLHYKRNELLPMRDLLSQVLGFQLVILGCCLLFLAILSITPGRWTKPFLYLGRISYGLYVFHIFAHYIAMRIMTLAHLPGAKVFGWMNALQLLLAFTITVAAAATSYRFFEKPFLRMKAQFTFIKTRTD